jgi:two-component system response regulator AtoC
LTGEQDSSLLASEARGRGAYDCLKKPIQTSEFLFALTRIRDRTRLRRKHFTLNLQLERADNERIVVAASDAMIEVLELLERAAEFDSPALLTGEMGTRKHLIAQAIHAQSARRSGPFIAVNCAGRSGETSLKKELFGAALARSGKRRAAHRGLIALAERGTLFLDQVDQLSAELQLGILRVIEENELWNVGERKARSVDVRVIASTAVDLAERVSEGHFDENLYRRITSIQIDLPPLRKRRKDIPLLIDQFLVHFRNTLGRDVGHLSDEALERLCDYSWPGNVRELQNTLERAVILADEEGITLAHLPRDIVETSRTPLSDSGESFALKPARQAFEADIITRALRATGGNRTRAATLLDISHRNLLYKLKAYDLHD